MADQQPPYPRFPIAEVSQEEGSGRKVYTVTTPWSIYFRNLRNDVNSTPIAQQVVSKASQNASIGTTTILTPDSDGYYAFQYYAAITTADGVSSSLTPVLSWTDGGIAKSKTFTAITGNTTATTDSDDYLIFNDGGSPITYSTTYASNTPGQMVYKLFAVLSSVAGA